MCSSLFKLVQNSEAHAETWTGQQETRISQEQSVRFCNIGASTFSLQAHSIQQSFKLFEAGNLKVYFCPVMAKFISCFLLCPAECLAVFSVKQKPWGIILFLESSAVTFLWVLHVQFIQHTIKQSRQEQFLVQMASKLHKEPLQCPSSSWSSWCCQEQTCLIVMKIPKFLKHFKCHILKVSERFEEYLIEIYLYISRKPN